jgi:hypothetical protein
MKIGILGSGMVGQTLAKGFQAEGHEVQVGSRDGHVVDGWDGDVGTFNEIASWSEVVVLAVKGMVAEKVVEDLGKNLDGKSVLDTTNPLTDVPAQDGVLTYFTGPNESLMERLQKIAPAAHFVKAFNSVGNAVMVHPDFSGTLPTMFIAGNNDEAKVQATGLLKELGWEVADMGKAAGARAIEPLCMLWCIPGFLRNEWSHAFKLLKK